MFLNVQGSCDPEKLQRVIVASTLVFKRFYSTYKFTKEDQEDILLEVAYRFEQDKSKFPASVYVRHCENKVIDFIKKARRQKRTVQKVVDGKTVYYETLSMNTLLDPQDKDSVELGNSLPQKDANYSIIEILADVEAKSPELVPLVKAVLQGETLTIQQKRLLRKVISREDLV